MRHQKKGSQFSRDSKGRKNLSRGLITSLVLNGKIKTTEAKAKLLKRAVEKMLNYASKDPKLTEQRLFSWVPNKKVVDKLTEILPNVGKEKSGILNLTKLGPREGDQAEIVQVEWKNIPEEVIPSENLQVKKTNKKDIKNDKK